jgi:vitamin B12/bleomycin/antimicrobial peptide transport system ATP-binding/permease protein
MILPETTQNLKFNRQFFRDLWQLLKPYWVSEEKWSALLLLFIVTFCIVAQVRLSVAFNFLRKDLYNAMQNYDKPMITHLIGHYVLLLVITLLIFGYNVYFNGLLTIRWRRWMTKQYLHDWLQKYTHYRMQVLHKTVDNPDQRISEDLATFPTTALNLFSNLLDSFLTLIAFGAILWSLSGNLIIPLDNFPFTIHGYLLWAALFYACAGTWLNARIGRPLASLNYLQERFNANFRFGMARFREMSEQVALYKGENTERNKLTQIFSTVFTNFISIIKTQRNLVFFQNGYTFISFVLGVLLAMPLFFAKKIQIGGVVQILESLNQVIGAFSIFIVLFTTLAAWRSVVSRLAEFTQSMQEARDLATASNINISEENINNLVIDDLELQLPDGKPLLQHINLTVQPGETILLNGPSGVGKSTLLRTLAGIWPHGRGVIHVPRNQRMMFLPQKPYLPLGTLREALLYPSDVADINDATLIEFLNSVGLGKLTNDLVVTRNWSQELSLGEQQLVAFIRVLLQKPAWLFLDEATSALDETNEKMIYQKLRAYLPRTAIISVGHRSSLNQFHERKIEFTKQ